MGEFTKSMKAYLYDKAVSPLSGAFVVSCILWNFKFFIVLFLSPAPVADRFSFISNVLYPGRFDSLLQFGLFPALTTFAYIFIYPIPAKWAFWYSRKCQHELHEIKRQIEDSTPLSIEESRNLRRLVIEHEIEFDKQILKKDAVIKALTEQLDAVGSGNAVGVVSESPMPADLDQGDFDELEISILVLISEAEINELSELFQIINLSQDKKNASRLSITKLQLILGRLLRRGVIRDFGQGYRITQVGREALDAHNAIP